MYPQSGVGETLTIIGIILLVLYVILVVIWIFLPFAVYGIKPRLDRIIELLESSSAFPNSNKVSP